MSHDSPSETNLLDGAAVARSIRERVRRETTRLIGSGGSPPRLRVILLGNDGASEAYVASKTRAAREVGILADTVRLPSGTRPDRLLAEVRAANGSSDVDGILVQLPLEPGHDPRRVFDTLDPSKDVDAFHPQNVGLLHQGRPRFVPCTPAGILALLDAYGVVIAGRRAVVVGRSDIVGKPCAALLTARDATVTLAHSKTPRLPEICRQAEILVVAVGRPGLVTREFVAPGAVVVDVGMNRVGSIEELPEALRGSVRIREALAARGRALVGDVVFDEVAPVASRITPVPGGVGPLTVAMLLENTLKAARERRSATAASDLDPLTL